MGRLKHVQRALKSASSAASTYAPITGPRIEGANGWLGILAHTPEEPPSGWHQGAGATLSAVPGRGDLDGAPCTLLAPAMGAGWHVRAHAADAADEDLVVPTESLAPLPGWPIRGVSVGCLRDFAAAHVQQLAGASTESACDRVVRPLTAKAQTSLAACIERAGAAEHGSGRAWVGPPTVFISHARHCLFADLLAAIEAFESAQPADAPVYVWLDIFSQSQHRDPEPQMVRHTIRAIGHTCLVLSANVQQDRSRSLLNVSARSEGGSASLMRPGALVRQATGQLAAAAAAASPVALRPALLRQATGMLPLSAGPAAWSRVPAWPTPPPLERAWCLWETFSTLHSGGQLSVQVAPREVDMFTRCMLGGFTAVLRAVSSFDARRARCTNEAEDAVLHSLFEAIGGHEAMQHRVARAMRHWLVGQGLSALARLPEDQRGTCMLMTELGTLLHCHGRLQEAAELFVEALHACRERLGEWHPHTLLAKNALAAIYMTRDPAGKLALRALPSMDPLSPALRPHPMLLQAREAAAVRGSAVALPQMQPPWGDPSDPLMV